MKRNHRIAAISAPTIGAAILLAGVLAPQAVAAPGCQDAAFCVWPGANYPGDPQTTITDFETGCVAVAATLSAWNEFGQTVSLYDSQGTRIVSLDDSAGVSDTVRAARYACLGSEAAMNHNEAVLLD